MQVGVDVWVQLYGALIEGVAHKHALVGDFFIEALTASWSFFKLLTITYLSVLINTINESFLVSAVDLVKN